MPEDCDVGGWPRGLRGGLRHHRLNRAPDPRLRVCRGLPASNALFGFRKERADGRVKFVSGEEILVERSFSPRSAMAL
jgi:hypothetical protein